MKPPSPYDTHGPLTYTEHLHQVLGLDPDEFKITTRGNGESVREAGATWRLLSDDEMTLFGLAGLTIKNPSVPDLLKVIKNRGDLASQWFAPLTRHGVPRSAWWFGTEWFSPVLWHGPKKPAVILDGDAVRALEFIESIDAYERRNT